MTGRPGPRADGSLEVTVDLVIPSRELRLRATTPGGPGGQHANRTLSRVVASFDVAHSSALSEAQRERLIERIGPLVSATSSGSRSQAQNRSLALERLARRLGVALFEEAPRRPTKPTRASVGRRLDNKRRQSLRKSQRRSPGED